jgi:acetyl esterase/lipase
MDIEQIHPELRARVRRLPPLSLDRPWLLPAIRFAGTVTGSARRRAGIKVGHHSVGAARVRVYRPAQTSPGAAVLWIHGGGFLIGSARQDDRRCVRYARELGVVVVSPDYRLAPEHPFPAALDDCFSAWRWLQDSAMDLGVEPHRTVVAGESAGGGLAASVVQRIHDADGVQPVAQLLLCPMLDDRTSARDDLDAIGHRVWNNRANRVGWAGYLGHTPGQQAEPQYAVAARRAQLDGLPSARVGVGDIDLFYEEDRLYCERLVSASVPCELDIVHMAPHGFQTLVPRAPVSIAFERRNDDFLRRHLVVQV